MAVARRCAAPASGFFRAVVAASMNVVVFFAVRLRVLVGTGAVAVGGGATEAAKPDEALSEAAAEGDEESLGDVESGEALAEEVRAEEAFEGAPPAEELEDPPVHDVASSVIPTAAPRRRMGRLSVRLACFGPVIDSPLYS